MHLFYIAEGSCQHITEIMPGIKTIYQMEAEFHPYLQIEFLPQRDETHEGIILQTKTTTIRRDYNFKDKKAIDDLRNLIWHHLKRENNIKNVQNENDFRENRPNHVTQGWQARKRLANKDVCCKLVLDALTLEVIKNNILHEVYKLSPIDKQDRKTCMQVRGGECGDNYPPNTATYKRCVDETTWLCKNGYPINKRVEAMNQLVKNVRLNLYKYLDENNLKVNKRKFDEIIDAGLFDDLGNRMGNKVANDKNVRASLDQIFTEKDYYLGLIEGFDGEYKEEQLSGYSGIFTWNRITGLILILVVLLYVYMLAKKN